MARISTALQELDGRTSMQILNEGLRNREEIAYLGGQVAGMNRQVHWLTSTQLQRQQGPNSPRAPSASSSNVSRRAEMGDAAEGGASASGSSGVKVAVNAMSTAATALRGAARVVNVGPPSPNPTATSPGLMRRGPSEEGRTKL
jgi:hypothetical protein